MPLLPQSPGRRARERAPFAALLALFLPLSALPPVASAQTAAEKERELEALRSRIEALERDIGTRETARSRELKALREAEVAAGAAASRLANTRERLAAKERELEGLERERAAADRALAAEREALAAQLREAYRSGRQERLRLVLNQEDPARLGRMLAYYGYFNAYRADAIAAVTARLAEVRRLREAAATARAELMELVDRQRAEVDRLAAMRAERSEAVARLERTLASDAERLARLRSDEATLAELVERLRAELARFPDDARTPFAERRGALEWPVAGRVLARFGRPRAEVGLRWNGLLLGAERGTGVRAVHHGRVVYADWLPGMGLLLIIDHGGGWLSLYGHNEALLRSAGDWVDAGEVIARVGDSGGRARSGLYFEIRKDGRPTDPGPWLGAPPGS